MRVDVSIEEIGYVGLVELVINQSDGLLGDVYSFRDKSMSDACQ